MTPAGRESSRRSTVAPASVVDAVSRAAEKLDAAVDPLRAAGDLLAALADAFGAARGSLLVLNPRTGRLRIVAAWGLPAIAYDEDLPPAPRRISDRVLRERQGVILNGDVRDPRFVSSAPHDSIASAMCVPLPGARGAAGVLNLARTGSASVFTPADLAALGAVAPAIGAVLERTLELRDARAFHRDAHAAIDPPFTLPLRTGELVVARIPGRSPVRDLCERFVHADGTVTVMLAEPFGDGVAAWRLGEWLRGLFHGSVAHAGGLGALAAAIHARVAERAEGGATRMWLGSMSPRGELHSCAAGYPSPFLLPAEGALGPRLLEGGPPPGATTGPVDYETTSLRMLSGDALVVASDGVLLAASATGEPFGEARALEQLDELRRRPLVALAEGLTQAARQHAELASPVDDLVALALRFTRDV